MTVSVEKTKGTVVGINVVKGDNAPLLMESGFIQTQFFHLESIIANDGEITLDVASRIAKGSREFGCLRKPIFQNSNVSV